MVFLDDQFVQFLGEVLPATIVSGSIDGEGRLDLDWVGIIDHHLLVSLQKQGMVLDPHGGLDVSVPRLDLLLVDLVTVTFEVLNGGKSTSFSLTT
jgi:hypothetical protein